MLLKYSFIKTNMDVLILRLLICDCFRQKNHQLITEEFVIISLIIYKIVLNNVFVSLDIFYCSRLSAITGQMKSA